MVIAGLARSVPKTRCPAFEYAIQAGVDVLELDLAVTRDNVFVVSHDPEINPSICIGGPTRTPIRQLTLEQLKTSRLRVAKEPCLSKTASPYLERKFRLSMRCWPCRNAGKFEFNIETKIFANRPEVERRLLKHLCGYSTMQSSDTEWSGGSSCNRSIFGPCMQ